MSHDCGFKQINNGIAQHSLHVVYSLWLRVGVTTWPAVLPLDF